MKAATVPVPNTWWMAAGMPGKLSSSFPPVEAGRDGSRPQTEAQWTWAAVVQGGGKPLVIEQVADPTPGPGQVVIRVGRCGICGSDLHMAQNHSCSFQPGDVPGHEFAGEVVALGAGTEHIKPGDRVAVMPFLSCGKCRACLAGAPAGCVTKQMLGSWGVKGGYAEYVVADARWCVQLPKSLGFDDGALVEPLAV